ncbi:MAG: PAS domain-containing protein, partial [Chloroflexota bacterium]
MITNLRQLWPRLRERMAATPPPAAEALLNGLSDAVFVLDRAARVVALNEAARDLIGKPMRQVIGQPITAFPPLWQALLAAARGPAHWQNVIAMPVGGAVHVYGAAVTHWKDRLGLVGGRMLVLHDVTAHQQAQTAAVDPLEEVVFHPAPLLALR